MTDSGEALEPSHRRLRIDEVDVSRTASAEVTVRVTLGDGTDLHLGRATGVGSRVVELRVAADATVEAIDLALDRHEFVRLVGVKQIHAFDQDLVLVALRPGDRPARQLLGAVPIRDDPARAVVAAVLDAVNRVLDPELA